MLSCVCFCGCLSVLRVLRVCVCVEICFVCECLRYFSVFCVCLREVLVCVFVVCVCSM